ncbi:OLC1v1026223C1 [Oldenlandia corymbosa var. corymbosa]|uniref:OLC1v1026223C1 n=1 Tax=Oldenlandia corymbosa var. corymbosa TaxID=529605 RepID=A0AAV1C777_OLDCO|nr:OLC1v1026223C1 [Oldenlandia corymbosa var. corymbosa]
MADAQQSPAPAGDTNPIVAFFSNFLKIFNLPFPFPPPAPKTESVDSSVDTSNATKASPVSGEVAAQNKKPSVVRFPQPPQEESFPSLKVEGDEVQETSPSTLWQVYALGGFLVLSWAWKRWNERKGSKKSPEEDPPAPE